VPLCWVSPHDLLIFKSPTLYKKHTFTKRLAARQLPEGGKDYSENLQQTKSGTLEVALSRDLGPEAHITGQGIRG
jgi:hypothetical protein